MKGKRRVILNIPSGTIDRREVRKVFAELRDKRLARERRVRDLSAHASPEGRAITVRSA
jgi:hypothetical protein